MTAVLRNSSSSDVLKNTPIGGTEQETKRIPLRHMISDIQSDDALGTFSVEKERLPHHVTRHDICVDVEVALEKTRDDESEADQIQGNPEIAEQVRDSVEMKLRRWYTGEKKPICGACFVLKVYVVVASTGANSLLNVLSFGQSKPAEVCLEWVLQSSDGNHVYKAGRVGINSTSNGRSSARSSVSSSTSSVSGAEGRFKRYGKRHPSKLTKEYPQILVGEIVKTIGIANRSASQKHRA